MDGNRAHFKRIIEAEFVPDLRHRLDAFNDFVNNTLQMLDAGSVDAYNAVMFIADNLHSILRSEELTRVGSAYDLLDSIEDREHAESHETFQEMFEAAEKQARIKDGTYED